MKHISVLVPRGAAVLACIQGPRVLFSLANELLAQRGLPPGFQMHLVGLDRTPQVYDTLFTVAPDRAITEDFRTDLIVIPAVNGDMRAVIEANRDFLPWIAERYKGGAEVASLCAGAFLLAATGLVKGRKCATHWLYQNEFRALFPEVDLRCDTVVTDEHGIYSSAGALSFWNLLLHLLEKYTDRDMAVYASKFYEIEIDRHNQASFTMFRGRRDHQDEAVKKVQAFVEGNTHRKITVDNLSGMFALGRRSLERRFKKATGITVSEYIQNVKMEAAKKRFETSRKNISEVMYEVGYSDTKAFRTIFKGITGMTPIDYRNKYNKEPVPA
ncbi:MAG TPA: helix-turn-helix domain-containing protein [Fibrobacteria bacterium]|nr:helix-turn-helix domain-containing protein [Fibrobacteria bacterium]